MFTKYFENFWLSTIFVGHGRPYPEQTPRKRNETAKNPPMT